MSHLLSLGRRNGQSTYVLLKLHPEYLNRCLKWCDVMWCNEMWCDAVGILNSSIGVQSHQIRAGRTYCVSSLLMYKPLRSKLWFLVGPFWGRVTSLSHMETQGRILASLFFSHYPSKLKWDFCPGAYVLTPWRLGVSTQTLLNQFYLDGITLSALCLRSRAIVGMQQLSQVHSCVFLMQLLCAVWCAFRFYLLVFAVCIATCHNECIDLSYDCVSDMVWITTSQRLSLTQPPWK